MQFWWFLVEFVFFRCILNINETNWENFEDFKTLFNRRKDLNVNFEFLDIKSINFETNQQFLTQNIKKSS